MKKVLMIAVLLVSASAVFGQAAAPKQNGPVMTTNTGNEPLIITNVQVSCGCTTPKGWPRDPVMPGGKGELTVAFNSTGKMGAQTKPVTIISNAINDTKLVFNTVVLDKKPQ